MLFDLDGPTEDSVNIPMPTPDSAAGARAPPSASPLPAGTPAASDAPAMGGDSEERGEGAAAGPARPHAQPGHAIARTREEQVRVPPRSSHTTAMRIQNQGFVLRPSYPGTNRVQRRPL